MKTRFFLGANSAGGFRSLYRDFVDPISDRLNIIKSGPGSGKSTFMKIIADRAEKAGLDVELIQCSGDPDSLDGVYLPQLTTAYVDGTSPHVIEPTYSGSGDNYIDLSKFYDRTGIRSVHSEIVELTDAYKSEYAKAYKLIAAYSNIKSALMPFEKDYVDKGLKRITGITDRELKTPETKLGRTKKRYLDAISCKGKITMYDTVVELCDRVFLLDGTCEISGPALNKLYNRGRELGLNMVLCLSPVDDSIMHILIPELSVAFVTDHTDIPFPHPVFRRVRLDSIPDAGFVKAAKEAKHAADPLINLAVQRLKRAKELHDELEKRYNPYVDFDAVRSLAEAEADILIK